MKYILAVEKKNGKYMYFLELAEQTIMGTTPFFTDNKNEAMRFNSKKLAEEMKEDIYFPEAEILSEI